MPENDPQNIEARIAVMELATALGKQLTGMKEAKLPLTALFSMVSKNPGIYRAMEKLAETLGEKQVMAEAPQGSPVAAFDKLVDAAEKKGVATAELKAVVKDISTIHGMIRDQNAGLYKAARIARNYLRKGT